MPHIQLPSKDEEFDPEVWGYFAHKETKVFNSSAPSGLVRPIPVRLVPPFFGDKDKDSMREKSTPRHSRFLPIIGGFANSQDPVPSSLSSASVSELTKVVKVKEDEIRFHQLQRTKASEREENLRAQLTSTLNMVDTVRTELQEAKVGGQSLEVENGTLQTRIRHLQTENLTLTEKADRLVQELSLIGKRPQTGEGEGVRRQSLAERSGVTQNTRFDLLVISKDQGSVRDFDSWGCNFISPVKLQKPSTISGNDKRGDISQESKRGEKTSKSMLGRFGMIFKRTKGLD